MGSFDPLLSFVDGRARRELLGLWWYPIQGSTDGRGAGRATIHFYAVVWMEEAVEATAGATQVFLGPQSSIWWSMKQ